MLTLDAQTSMLLVIDFQARLSADVTITVYEGRCMHLDADGEFAMGCVGNQMGIFASVGSDRPAKTGIIGL